LDLAELRHYQIPITQIFYFVSPPFPFGETFIVAAGTVRSDYSYRFWVGESIVVVVWNFTLQATEAVSIFGLSIRIVSR